MPKMSSGCIQLGSLIVAVVGLVYLVRYVAYTKTIAEQAIIQSEAVFKPAIIAVHGGDIKAAPGLRNIGNGPALDVEWEITGTDKRGKIACLEVGTEEFLPLSSGVLPLFESTSTTGAAIKCSYRSISGNLQSSISDYDHERGRFSTKFTDDSHTRR
jgi:hypothetical protein